MKHRKTALATTAAMALVCAVILPSVVGAEKSTPWNEILGESHATIPASPEFLEKWRDNLPRAMQEARRDGRPLFITLRCLPCKQCSDFDKEILEGGPDLDPLLRQFVTVRLTNAEHLDFRIFPVEGYSH